MNSPSLVYNIYILYSPIETQREASILHKKGLVIGIIILMLGVNIGSTFAGDVDVKTMLSVGFDGNTLYVGGSGPNNYTTIQSAIDNALNGDTVFVYDDSAPYNENILIDKSINLIGEERDTTIIDGGIGKSVVNITASWVNISVFKLINNGVNWWEHFGILISSPYTSIFNNIISLKEGIGVQLYSDYNTISNNTISNNYHGISLFECSYNTVSYNIILDNYIGIKFKKSDNNTFFQNVINSNSAYGISLNSWSHYNTFYENIISSNDMHGLHVNICNYNTFYRNTIEYNVKGLTLRSSYYNIIKNNNFKGNILHARFDESLLNTWDGNYWGRSRLIPKFIFGILCIFPSDLYSPGLYIPWVNIDWHPAQEPYDIGA